jgi:hypothetical protein
VLLLVRPILKLIDLQRGTRDISSTLELIECGDLVKLAPSASGIASTPLLSRTPTIYFIRIKL